MFAIVVEFSRNGGRYEYLIEKPAKRGDFFVVLSPNGGWTLVRAVSDSFNAQTSSAHKLAVKVEFDPSRYVSVQELIDEGNYKGSL